jgi:hypothetical protein
MVRLLRQQTSITVDRLLTKENKPSVSVFRLQQTNESCDMYECIYVYIYIY